MLAEIRTEVQSKKNSIVADVRKEVQDKKDGKIANPSDELSQEHKANGTRVRKSMEELKGKFGGLSCENKEIMFLEIELMAEGIRTEVQSVKNHG